MRHQRHGLDTRHVTWMKGGRSILFAKKQKTNKQTKKQNKWETSSSKRIHTGHLNIEIRSPGDWRLRYVQSVSTGGSTGQSFPCTSLVIRSFNPNCLVARGMDTFFYEWPHLGSKPLA